MPVAIEAFEQEDVLKEFFTKITGLPPSDVKKEARSIVKRLKKSHFAEFLSEAASLGEFVGEGKRSRRGLRSIVASISSGSFSRLTIEEMENEKLKVGDKAKTKQR